MKPIEYLSQYLPYEVNLKYSDGTVGVLTIIHYYIWETHPLRLAIGVQELEHEWMFKPILRPLSDLTKEIDHNGEKFVPLTKLYDFKDYSQFFDDIEEERYEMYSPIRWPYELFIKLISWHFDVFNLHEKGQCIYYDEI